MVVVENCTVGLKDRQNLPLLMNSMGSTVCSIHCEKEVDEVLGPILSERRASDDRSVADKSRSHSGGVDLSVPRFHNLRDWAVFVTHSPCRIISRYAVMS